MVRTLAIAGDNVSAAVRLYAETFPQRRPPSWRTMLGATQRLRDYGQFNHPTADRHPDPRYPVWLAERILDHFRDHPEASTADGARLFGVSQWYVWKTLRDDGLYPYHHTPAQELNEQDYAPRVEFCRWLLQENRSILWTDECTFVRKGLFNCHNQHLWMHENPHSAYMSHFQHRFSVNVWAGVIGNSVVGPFFLDRLTGTTYLEFLRSDLPRLIYRQVPLAYTRDMYYQHDGAPAHFQLTVRQHLHQEYEGRCIGRGLAVPWPARSPDLTPCDFFLWGAIKTLVYTSEQNFQNVRQLKRAIRRAFRIVKGDTYA